MVSLQIAKEFQLWYVASEDSAGQFVEKDDGQSEEMPPEEPAVMKWRTPFQTSFVGDDMKVVGQTKYVGGELLIFHPSGASSSSHLCHSY